MVFSILRLAVLLVVCRALILRLFFMIQGQFYKFYIYHVQNVIFISTECPFHTLYFSNEKKFNITICKNFIRLQRSIGQKKGVQFRIKKNS